MAKRKAAGSKIRQSSLTNMTKGRMVEAIVAHMHERPGITVQLNQKLPPISGKGIKREIDVLLTTSVAGYQVRVAIECKNEGKPIGSPYIDAYVGKLQYLGIPVQQGIFVSASGYTQGALERAQAAGIRALTLEDALAEIDPAIAQALQSTIYLLPCVSGVEEQNFINEAIDVSEVMLFLDAEGQPIGAIPDMVWRNWIDGTLDATIGEHKLEIELPEEVYHRHDGRLSRVNKATIKVDVLGLVILANGAVEAYRLVNAIEKETERARVSASFMPPPPGRYDLLTVRTEEELAEALEKPALVKITTRVRLPRINLWNLMYWPPSQRAEAYVADKMRAFEAGLIPDPRPFNIDEVEGTDISAIWEWLREQAEVPSHPQDKPETPDDDLFRA